MYKGQAHHLEVVHQEAPSLGRAQGFFTAYEAHVVEGRVPVITRIGVGRGQCYVAGHLRALVAAVEYLDVAEDRADGTFLVGERVVAVAGEVYVLDGVVGARGMDAF